MTEEEWLNSEDLGVMLRWDQVRSRARDLRLYNCACSRLLEPWFKNPRLLKALEASEQYADGLLNEAGIGRWNAETFDAWQAVVKNYHGRNKPSSEAAHYAVAKCCVPNEYSGGPCKDMTARILQEDRAFGKEARAELKNRFLSFLRDILGNPFRPVAFDPAWRTSTAVALAQQMYDSRDFSLMPILGDALEDAGCDSADILDHCRGDGPHVRGCWVVDLVLGKS